MAQQCHSSCVGKYVFCDPSNLQHDNDHSSKARLPVWVNRAVLTLCQLLPVCLGYRTSPGHPGWSGSCQLRKSRAGASRSLGIERVTSG